MNDLIQGIKLHGLDSLLYAQTDADISKYTQRLAEECLDYPVPKENINSKNWFIPNNYKDLDIVQWVIDQCKTDEELDRIARELAEYQRRGLIPVLLQMKYIVDTLRENNILWGVGRGSSVASYVLYKIGVHKIDSIKYDLPIEEFFKGEQNG